MSKIDLARENEQLRTAYQQARKGNPLNTVIAALTCVLCIGIGWLLAGGTRPALPWLRPAAPVFPTPQIVIRDAVPAFVPPAVPSALPAERPAAQPAAVPAAEGVSNTPRPVAPVGIKVIVIKPADGSGPIVLRDGTKYRGRP